MTYHRMQQCKCIFFPIWIMSAAWHLVMATHRGTCQVKRKVTQNGNICPTATNPREINKRCYMVAASHPQIIGAIDLCLPRSTNIFPNLILLLQCSPKYQRYLKSKTLFLKHFSTCSACDLSY